MFWLERTLFQPCAGLFEAASSVVREQRDIDFLKLIKHVVLFFFPDYNHWSKTELKKRGKSTNELLSASLRAAFIAVFLCQHLCLPLSFFSYPVFTHKQHLHRFLIISLSLEQLCVRVCVRSARCLLQEHPYVHPRLRL